VVLRKDEHAKARKVLDGENLRLHGVALAVMSVA